MDDRIVPLPFRLAGVIFQYFFVWAPAVLAMLLLGRFVRQTSRARVALVAALRTAVIAPIIIDFERSMFVVPLPLGVIDFISGDGMNVAPAQWIASVVITFFACIAGSRMKSEWDQMRGPR